VKFYEIFKKHKSLIFKVTKCTLVKIIMKTLIIILICIIFASCQTSSSDKKLSIQKIDPCQNLVEKFNTPIIYKLSQDTSSLNTLLEIVNLFESKGNLRLVGKKAPKDFKYFQEISLDHTIDTCNHKFVTQTFIFKNVLNSSCFFKSKTPLKGTKDYYPKFTLTQWNFANNSDRDSALKLKNWIYSSDGIIAYDYRFNQTVIADKRIYQIETGAGIFEGTNIEYAKYLETHLAGQKNNSY
jgi:hypothetical protein